ncbi:hypothetical protein [Streptomyces jeddahensis]|uniref:Uncharacterized protein n=1 Tax=Streptomyces jeddahensis TaxID=1716141 RepID=A0A177HK36_9ACTN|nr:hypothetical protein [Streptomyces jeddahensis]OAH11243.1 hypothetical protein STSP_53770 [Streptomyces jeddahensis]
MAGRGAAAVRRALTVVPVPVRRLIGHELRVLMSLGLWIARRSHGVAAGERGYGYARGHGAVMYGFAFVCVIETFAMAVLLRDWPAVERAVLFLDVYTVVLVIGMYAAWVTRPHVLGPTELRLRRGALVDLRIPLADIAAVRRELRATADKPGEGELRLDMGSQTSVTLELAAPVRHTTLLGRSRTVRTIHFHADEPDRLVREIRDIMARSGRRGSVMRE